MIQYFKRSLKLLRREEKTQVYWLLVLSVIAAIVQTTSILSIMPFIVLLANPAMLETNEWISRFHEASGAGPYYEFLVLLGSIGILALAIGNLIVALETWLVDRFLVRTGHRLEKKLLQRMLGQPYEYFARHHSGRLGNIVLDQVDRMMGGIVGTFIAITSSLALAVFIVLTLLVISLKTTLVTLAALVVLYLIVFLLLRRRIAQHGADLTRLAGDMYATVKETLDGVKEIKTSRAESFFADRFEASGLPLSRLAIRISVLGFLPNIILETLVFSGLVAVALYFVVTTADSGVSLSYIALYGMATYRLVPSLKSVFEGMSAMEHNADAINVIEEHLKLPTIAVDPIALQKPARRIRFSNVSYGYAGAEGKQLEQVDIRIPIGTSTCLFGESGAGKTTLINILAGLIAPQEGEVLSDDTTINLQTVDSWKAHIGYCPQQIFLFEDSIASNIAFGVHREEIDMNRVREVGELAMLEEFVAGETVSGYDTLVGEGGKSLSGGQRQRIGIARALYRDPGVLILDESLVGLDAPNQVAILDNLFGLREKTLVFSSHNEAIAKRCDKIVVMDQGRVVAEGQYGELIANVPRFVELLSSFAGEEYSTR